MRKIQNFNNYSRLSSIANVSLIPHLGLVALFVWTIMLLIPALANPFYLDDIPRIVDNPDLRSWSNLWSRLIFRPSETVIAFGNDPSRPLVFLLYGLVYQIFGPSPWAFHALNLALHLLNAVLLMCWIKKVDLRTNDKFSNSSLIIAAAFFCLSPIQVGTVAYAYGLSDILVTTWLLLLLIVGWDSKVTVLDVALLSLILIFALASKQVAVVFPAILWMRLIVFEDWSENRSRRVFLCLWLVFLVTLYLIGRQLYFGGIGDLEGRGEIKNAWQYLAMQPYAVWRYVVLSFIPFGLSIDHAPEMRAISELDWILMCGFFFGVILVFIRAVRRWCESQWRVFLFLALLFFALLAPTSSFFPTVDYMVERRVYMANIATAVILACLVQRIIQSRSVYHVLLLYVVAFGFIGVFSWQNWSRAQLFSNPVAVWNDVRRLYPESARARRALGSLYFENKKFVEALNELLPLTQGHDYMSMVTVASIYADPSSPIYNTNLALTYYDRAQALQPAMALAYYAKGKTLQNLNQPMEAAEQFLRALAVDPRHSDAHNNLGHIYFTQRRYEEAAQAFRQAWQFATPIIATVSRQASTSIDAADARIPMLNLATTYAMMGRFDDAFALCQQGLRQIPQESAFLNILSYLFEQKTWRFYDENRALEYLRQASLRSEDDMSRFRLARKLQDLGQMNEARQVYMEALRSKPDDIEASKNLALLEWQLGQHEVARHLIEAAVKLAPERQDLRRILDSLQLQVQSP